MGVPRLAGWVRRTFPGTVLRGEVYTGTPVTHIGIDFNALVHEALGEALQEGATPNPLTLVGRCEDAIMRVCQWVWGGLGQAPAEGLVLFVAADGFAPLAKCAQQRSRRARAWAEGVAEGREDACWRNEITPGTPFMQAVDAEMGRRVREGRIAAQLHRLGNASCAWSPSSERGEGEHKIMAKCATQAGRWLIWGNDADLVVLGMMRNARAASFGGGEVVAVGSSDLGVVDVVQLVREMELDCAQVVAMCVFITVLGNDFLPPLGGCFTVSPAMMRRALAYAHSVRETPDNHSAAGVARSFTLVLEFLARDEECEFSRLHRRFVAEAPGALGCPSYRHAGAAVNPPAAGWRARYCRMAFDARGVQPSKAIQSYVQGLLFVMRYYSQVRDAR